VSPQPRWTVPVNFRAVDRPTLDAAIAIARKEGTELTSVIRNAVQEYVKTKLGPSNGLARMDQYFDSSATVNLQELLKPDELRTWSDSDLLRLSKQVRARKQELARELQRRGYLRFEW
jgi:hypothetical protein